MKTTHRTGVNTTQTNVQNIGGILTLCNSNHITSQDHYLYQFT